MYGSHPPVPLVMLCIRSSVHTNGTTKHPHTHTPNLTHRGTPNMPGLVVNTQEAMKQREAFEPGEYHVTYTGYKLVEAASADKYPGIQLEFTGAEDEEEYVGRKAYRFLSASPKALPFMVDAAVALGGDIDELTQPSVDMEEQFKGFVGAEAWIKTSQRAYKRAGSETETMQTNVDEILAAPSY